jgi:DNA replication protein DnaC
VPGSPSCVIPPAIEDVDYQTPRGLDRALFLKLSACDWIAERRNLLITGASGLGKSWLACALGHKASRENIPVLYARMPRLFAELGVAHGDARYARLLKSIARVKLLILDDWGPEALTANQARDLLEIVEDRYDKGSLIITSQVPIDRWHNLIGVPTLADAILDRVIHNAYRVELSGESLRKQRPRFLENDIRARARRSDPRVDQGRGQSGLRYGAREGALRPLCPPPPHRRFPTRPSSSASLGPKSNPA